MKLEMLKKTSDSQLQQWQNLELSSKITETKFQIMTNKIIQSK